MASIDDSDVPETGAVFTFGRSRFADNLANKFWIRNDKIVTVACGDEHSIIVTERGRLYGFGTNDWGQLGLGHTKCANKPTFIKVLKAEKMVLAACGRTHSLAASESGKLFSFGAGGDGQLGHGDTEDQLLPKQIPGLPLEKVKMLSCGVYHSAALYESGDLYIWGASGDGQTGHEEEEILTPRSLSLDGKVCWVSCGYYHSAAITETGKLYTFGENENGKLGLKEEQLKDTSRPQPVATKDGYFTAVACGSGHTIALTKNGKVFSFGDGSRGQLGQGTRVQELKEPGIIQQLSHLKIRSISCGDCHSAVVTENGRLYTFGDGRHGKLGQGEECFSNQFRPIKVSRFDNFNVESVSCGGCHTLVTAVVREPGASDEEETDNGLLNSSMTSSFSQVSMDEANATMKPFGLSNTVPLISPRDRRRKKESENLANSFSGGIGTFGKSGLPLASLSLDRSRLPQIPKLKDMKERKIEKKEFQNEESDIPAIKYPSKEKNEKASIQEENVKNSKNEMEDLKGKLGNKLGDEDTRLINTDKKATKIDMQKEEKEDEEESEEEETDEEEEDMQKIKTKSVAPKHLEVKKSVKIVAEGQDDDEEEDDEEDDDEDEEDDEEDDEDDEEGESEEETEEETEEEESHQNKESDKGKVTDKRKTAEDTSKKKELGNKADTKVKKSLGEDEEEDDDDDDEEEDDDDEEEEEVDETVQKAEEEDEEDDEGEDSEEEDDVEEKEVKDTKSKEKSKEKASDSKDDKKEKNTKKDEETQKEEESRKGKKDGKEAKNKKMVGKNEESKKKDKKNKDGKNESEVNNNENETENGKIDKDAAKEEPQPVKVSKFAGLFGKKKQQQPKAPKIDQNTNKKNEEKSEVTTQPEAQDQIDGPSKEPSQKEATPKKTGKSGICSVL